MFTRLLGNTIKVLLALFVVAPSSLAGCGEAPMDAAEFDEAVDTTTQAAGVVLAYPDPFEWMIVDKSAGVGPIMAGREYALFNAYPEASKFVRSSYREYGINLDWVFDGSKSIVKFISASGSPTIASGAPVAIYVSGYDTNRSGGYLYYKDREYGINLEFSSSPQFQWIVYPGNLGMQTGNRFNPARVQLHNTVAGSAVTYCKREYGINWKWAKDCSRKLYPSWSAPQ